MNCLCGGTMYEDEYRPGMWLCEACGDAFVEVDDE